VVPRARGARTEGVPFARPGSEFTRDFERLLAWLATRTDKSTIKRMLRIDWDTVGRVIKRVCDDELDPDRLDDLYDIGIDRSPFTCHTNYTRSESGDTDHIHAERAVNAGRAGASA
jgi:transposase